MGVSFRERAERDGERWLLAHRLKERRLEIAQTVLAYLITGLITVLVGLAVLQLLVLVW